MRRMRARGRVQQAGARMRVTLDKPVRDYTGRDVLRWIVWAAVITFAFALAGMVLMVAVPGCFALAWLSCQ